MQRCQQFPGIVITADDPGKVSIQGAEGAKLQQKASYGQREAAVDGLFKVVKQCAPNITVQIGGVGAPIRHGPGYNDYSNGIAHGFSVNCG